MTQMNLSTEQKQKIYRRVLWLSRGKGGWGETDWEFSINRCKLLYTEWINNKALLYSTGNYIQYPVLNHNGKDDEK